MAIILTFLTKRFLSDKGYGTLYVYAWSFWPKSSQVAEFVHPDRGYRLVARHQTAAVAPATRHCADRTVSGQDSLPSGRSSWQMAVRTTKISTFWFGIQNPHQTSSFSNLRYKWTRSLRQLLQIFIRSRDWISIELTWNGVKRPITVNDRHKLYFSTDFSKNNVSEWLIYNFFHDVFKRCTLYHTWRLWI